MTWQVLIHQPTLISRVKWYHMTWRALFISPYLLCTPKLKTKSDCTGLAAAMPPATGGLSRSDADGGRAVHQNLFLNAPMVSALETRIS
jgi:hypothetical protein